MTAIRSQRQILRFWFPLFLTWLLMAVEGPFIAAVIARLSGPTLNLAAYGLAVSLAMFFESPIIVLMSAANSLCRDRDSYLKLRRYAMTLNVGVTLAMALFLLPPLFRSLILGVMGLPAAVAARTYGAVALMLLWPGAIGYRRFYQGVLIRSGKTSRVAIGTAIRLSAIAGSATILALFTRLPGAWVGGAALSAGVISEAVASHWMARAQVRQLLATPPAPGAEPLTARAFAGFYIPLALTFLMSLGAHPLISFFLGRSRWPIESLAVMPVINSLLFVFRSPGNAYMEVGIALLGEREENFAVLRSFVRRLALISAAAMALITWTPLASLWFGGIGGLSPALVDFVRWPARIVVLIPFLEPFVSFQRSVLVLRRQTRPVTGATALDVALLASVLTVVIGGFHLAGALAAALAIVAGRLAAVLCLHPLTRTRCSAEERSATPVPRVLSAADE
ncbi:MAG TPA: hypothetical protein PKK12_09750, partial [Candidatus Aminicenantes bacterium]|nr:hypothetical protein [Candidatus Aminicenantes bacterium]